MNIICWCNRCKENFGSELPDDYFDNEDAEPIQCLCCGKTDRVSFVE